MKTKLYPTFTSIDPELFYKYRKANMELVDTYTLGRYDAKEISLSDVPNS